MLWTRLAGLMGLRMSRRIGWLLGLVVLAAALLALGPIFDSESFWASLKAAIDDPTALAVIGIVYFGAFALRAVLWTRLLPSLGFQHALAAIHISVAGNHLLPLRLGEALRVSTAVKRAGVRWSDAIASTLTLRAADTLGLLVLLAVLAPSLAAPAFTGPLLALTAAAAAACILGIRWIAHLKRSSGTLHLPGLGVALGSTGAWVLEAAVIWQAVRWAGLEITATEAVVVTAATIFSQVLAAAPGGFGTYEGAATAALVALGAPAGPALSAALLAHTLKTAYSLLAGGIALWHPSPGLLGRLRLDRSARIAEPISPPVPSGPVVLFLPALNEAANLPTVLARVPDRVCGRRVLCLVVDDGSSDATATIAASSGAAVVSHDHTQGLGAAVRTGLGRAVSLGCSAVAFCDADGEYDPAELSRLVEPIVMGRADFVTGSRFAGGRRRMKPHRMFGNKLLSVLLSLVARRRISDGQSGYRAFSNAAARSAEVIHDYNYAQVLTLDLLAKRFAHAEVPITYRYRTVGKSFVRLIPYLRKVLPAVYREINSPSEASAPTPVRNSV